MSAEAKNILVLASRSPRRAALLCELGIPFEVRPVEVDESAVAVLEPREAALQTFNAFLTGQASEVLPFSKDFIHPHGLP